MEKTSPWPFKIDVATMNQYGTPPTYTDGFQMFARRAYVCLFVDEGLLAVTYAVEKDSNRAPFNLLCVSPSFPRPNQEVFP